MPILNSSSILNEARKKGFAVGAFSANNMELVKVIAETAEEEKAPIILMVTEEYLLKAGLSFVVALFRVAGREASVPVAIHLDHARSFEVIEKCLQSGFTSVMYEASELEFEQNILATKKVCTMAHPFGASVEGELGKLPAGEAELSDEEWRDYLTNSDQVEEFVARTGVAALSVSIGNRHEVLHKHSVLNLGLLERISEKVSIPLTLHGCVSIPDTMVRESIRRGIVQVNAAIEYRRAFLNETRRYLNENPIEHDFLRAFRPGVETVKEIVRQKIRLYMWGELPDVR